MVAHVLTVAPVGFEGAIVDVESDIKKGLPSIQIVGLGTKSVDEAKERVRSAINNSLLDFPPRKITINLAPAELIKDGAHYDLPIALAILINSGQLRQSDVEDSVFAGELSLDGKLRPIKGAINIAEMAKKSGIKRVFVPMKNASQASMIDGIEVIGVPSIKDLYLHLKSELPLSPILPLDTPITTPVNQIGPTIDEIYGQEQAKRALTIAVSGRHNLLLTGPPGAGKTLLAKAIVGLMPDLTDEEKIAVTKLHSLAGEIDGAIVSVRPFRSPHHTTSTIAVVGGGTKPKPGEISLAHLGVLFLDEIPEYSRSVLEALRQPPQDKPISVSRVGGKMTYPADFMLIATMNPCPCGYLGDSSKECHCSQNQIISYQKRLSGPLLDRIDLVVNVSRVPNDILLSMSKMKTNKQQIFAKESIQKARKAQALRYRGRLKYNGTLSSSEVQRQLHVLPDAKELLAKAGEKIGLSARAYFKVIKVAQTIADMSGKNEIEKEHIAEALQYRQHNT